MGSYRVGHDWSNLAVAAVEDRIASTSQTLVYLQYQKNKQPDQKLGRRPKQTYLQRNIQKAHKHMKRYSTSLIIREMQIKTTMMYQVTWVRMAIIKKSTNNKCWRGCGEKGTLSHCWWECDPNHMTFWKR